MRRQLWVSSDGRGRADPGRDGADQRLTQRGRAELRSRLRDALKADCGFAPIYLELLHAIGLSSHGFDIDLQLATLNTSVLSPSPIKSSFKIDRHAACVR
jgi:hypothetical protein